MKVIFVGSNPSIHSPTSEAFHPATRSGKTLLTWIELANITDYEKINAINSPTEKNKRLNDIDIARGSTSLYEKTLHKTVVALGQVASHALSHAHVPHLSLDHPSGNNRKLNDPAYVDSMIAKLVKYVSDSDSAGVAVSDLLTVDVVSGKFDVHIGPEMTLTLAMEYAKSLGNGWRMVGKVDRRVLQDVPRLSDTWYWTYDRAVSIDLHPLKSARTGIRSFFDKNSFIGQVVDDTETNKVFLIKERE